MVTDVFAARIRACAARPGLQKCGGTKPCRGRKPEHGFVQPKMPEQGILQLPFVKRRIIVPPAFLLLGFEQCIYPLFFTSFSHNCRRLLRRGLSQAAHNIYSF